MKAKTKGAISLVVALCSVSVAGVISYQSVTGGPRRTGLAPTAMPTLQVDRSVLKKISQLEPVFNTINNPGQIPQPTPFIHLAALFGASNKDLLALAPAVVDKPLPPLVKEVLVTPTPQDPGKAETNWHYPRWETSTDKKSEVRARQPVEVRARQPVEVRARQPVEKSGVKLAAKERDLWPNLPSDSLSIPAEYQEEGSVEPILMPEPFPVHGLSMTFMSSDNKMAVIDGFLYEEGDQLSSGAQVVEILRNTVVLTHHEEPFTLSMESGFIGEIQEYALGETPTAQTETMGSSTAEATSQTSQALVSDKKESATAPRSGRHNPLGALGLRLVQNALKNSATSSP
ncbi:MAG: hypothetical protein HQL72_11900 [Magnetococcales bacterium]|nr:hypothetical protein [Magnetococcales bacterium]